MANAVQEAIAAALAGSAPTTGAAPTVRTVDTSSLRTTSKSGR